MKKSTCPKAFASMNELSENPLSRDRSSRGFTMVELLVASSLAALVAGTAMLLLIQSAKENKRGVADATVEQMSSDLQNKIIQDLRVMSAGEGVIFSSPATNPSGTILGYQNIIVARGPAPDYPRQQISFDPGTGRVLYNSNLSSTNAPAILVQTNSRAVVRVLSFSPSLKTDGTADNALVNVLIEMDDNGSSGRFGTSHSNNPANVWRSFAVKMRNN
jgi:prepilin-type N-terminal cleavage/methylation domain-containing protein